MSRISICFLLVAAFLVSESLALKPCRAFQCTNALLNPDNSSYGTNRVCAASMMVDYNPTVMLDSCVPADYTCLQSVALKLDNKTYCAPPYIQITGLYPGNSCSDPSNCRSGICTNGFCVGAGHKAVCTQNYDCDIGMYCDDLGSAPTHTCLDVIPVGQACSQSLKCGYGLICIQSMCVQALSLPVNSNVTNDIYGWLACSSISTTVGTDGHTTTCSNPPKLQGSVLQSQTGVTCKYQAAGATNPVTQNIVSACYFSQQGLAVCPLGIGDVQDQMQHLIANYFSKNLTNTCTLDQPLFQPCDYARITQNVTSQSLAYLLALHSNEDDSLPYLVNTAYIEDNSPCTKKTVTAFYWNLAGGSTTLLTIGVAGLIAAITWAL